MFTAQIIYSSRKRQTRKKFHDLVSAHARSLYRSGQAWGEEERIIWISPYRMMVILAVPEKQSLHPRFADPAVAADLKRLADASIEVSWSILGEEPETCCACTCRQRSWCCLFNTFLNKASPITCGDCRRRIPLYRLPCPEGVDPWYDLRCWEYEYRNCDRLNMRCGIGESFGEAQLREVDSELSREGRKMAEKLSVLLGTPCYYWLYNAACADLDADRCRPCPSCGGAWRIAEADEDEFLTFRCDPCRLVSNDGYVSIVD